MKFQNEGYVLIWHWIGMLLSTCSIRFVIYKSGRVINYWWWGICRTYANWAAYGILKNIAQRNTIGMHLNGFK